MYQNARRLLCLVLSAALLVVGTPTTGLAEGLLALHEAVVGQMTDVSEGEGIVEDSENAKTIEGQVQSLGDEADIPAASQQHQEDASPDDESTDTLECPSAQDLAVSLQDDDLVLEEEPEFTSMAASYDTCVHGAQATAKSRMGITLTGDLLASKYSELRYCCDSKYKVGRTPKKNSLAMWASGGSNSSCHVAFVTQVSGSKMYVIEGGYRAGGNWGSAGTRHEAWVPTSGPEYGAAYGGNLVGFVYLEQPNHDPVGELTGATGGDGTVKIKGLAVDPDASSVTVQLYANGPAGTGTLAGTTTTGVWGELNNTVSVSVRGTITLYAYALDNSSGKRYQLDGTHKVTVTEPKGSAVTSVAEGRYTLRSKLKGTLALDVQKASKDNSANVDVYAWNGGNNQRFDLKKNADGSYTLLAVHSGKAVEVRGASAASGANITQYDNKAGNGQKWYLDKNSDGTYSLRNRLSGMRMEVAGGKTDNGTNVRQATSSPWKRQMWHLVPVDAAKWTVKAADVIYNGTACTTFLTVSAGGLTLVAGTDYGVRYQNNTKVGTATVTITGKNGFSGTKTATFRVLGNDLATASVADIDPQAYTGAALTPKPSKVVVDGRTLKEGTDYVLSYQDNVEIGTATVTVAGIGDYTGRTRVTFAIEEPLAEDEKDLCFATVSGVSDVTYNGKAHTPKPVVKIRSTTLVEGRDYQIAYGENVDAGEGWLMIEAIGDFEGVIRGSFDIKPASIAKATVVGDVDKGLAVWEESPAITVKLGGVTLVEDTDYWLSSSEWSSGDGYVTWKQELEGTGNYTGSLTKTFKVKVLKPSWSGATRMPVKATAAYTVTNGSVLSVDESVVSVTGATLTAKKEGTAHLLLVDALGDVCDERDVTVYKIDGNTYELQSCIDKSLVLDIQGKSTKNSARMIVYTRNNGKNQRYQFKLQPDGSYGIRCVHSGKYVDVQGGGTKKSQAVIQYDWKAGANQRWRLTVDKSNYVTFVNVKSGMVFDVQGGKAAKGAKMIQYPANGGKNQKWVLNKK